ncbi:acyl transferase domain-containing protein/acyl carrier protein, partial [Paenibacillus phyllosphaerae]|nr:acyl transferase domain-containing protein/acyl carrier protein [Paenibacillus phyllosphaerae]
MNLNFEPIKPYMPGDDAFQVEELSSDEIAVVGTAFRLPGADTWEQLWSNLARGADRAGSFPDRRTSDIHSYQKQVGLAAGQFAAGSYIEEIDKFDHAYFRLSPKEASLMDPHQRMFLETAWSALEDAGYGGSALKGRRVGVFVGHSGFSPFSYLRMLTDLHPEELPLSVAGNLPGVLASRISYLLDLRGPSMLIDTTCSSSLVALHAACQSIRSGECDAALVGSAKLTLIPQDIHTQVGMESSDGRTRAFDADSDGTGNGEGVIAFLVKPLSRALADRDHIYAVIKGSAVNQDGSSIGLTVPNAAAQEDVIVRAWQHAGVEPESISYIEAHGTGTKLGDPIEIDGIKRAFGRYTKRKQFCAIGSMKTNMGHLDHAAGLAGLLKVIAAMQHKELPPTAHFRRPNPEIAFEQSPVYVLDEARPWTTEAGTPRRSGISAFGLSGTNCHVVVEEAPPREGGVQASGNGPHVLALSAKGTSGLSVLIRRYIGALERLADADTGAICSTANAGRGHYSHRLAIVGDSRETLLRRMRELAEQEPGQWNAANVWYGESGASAEAEAELRERAEQAVTVAREPDPGLRAEGIRQLAALYAQGAEMDWERVYRGQGHRKVSLPTYPFARTRCWIDLPEAAEAGMQLDREHLYHTVGWEAEDIASVPVRSGLGAVLLIRGGDEQSRELAHKLREQGRQVVEAIEPGSEEWSAEANAVLPTSGGAVRIPEDQAGYERLFADIQQAGIELTDIVHMRGIGNPDQDLEAELERGVYDLFRLVQAAQPGEQGWALTVIVREAGEVDGAEEQIRAAHGSLLGLLRIAGMDRPQLRCKGVDIDGQTTAAELAAELGVAAKGLVAYRSGTRYAEVVKRWDAAADKREPLQLEAEGAYLITGGTGRIGLELAAELAERAARAGVSIQLVLVQRTAFPAREQWEAELAREANSVISRRIRQIRSIEASGSRISIWQADIGDEAQTSAVLQRLRNEFGALKGIIHSAGVGVGERGRPLQEETEANLKRMLAPKVYGTELLDRLTQTEALDFFAVCSSAVTVAGGAGAGSYTAANGYLDSFAQKRNRQGKRTLALNWPTWAWEEDPGEAYRQAYASKQLFEVIEAEAARQVFVSALERGAARVIAGTVNRELLHAAKALLPVRMSAEFEAETKAKSAGGPSGASASAAAVPQLPMRKKVRLQGRSETSYSETEQLIGEIWGDALGFAELDVTASFYELGGDSIFAIQMVNRLNREAGLELTAADVLSRPTVAQLAAWVEKKRPLYAVAVRPEPVKAAVHAIPAADKQETYPLSSAQNRMYILDQFDQVHAGYNMPALILTEQALNVQRAEEALQRLVERHEALRTTYELADGEPVQRITEAPEACAVVDRIGYVAEEELEASMARFVRPFDLSRDVLIRMGIGETDGGRGLLYLDLHHIASDGMTMAVVMQDFMALYAGEQLEPQRIQYKDYAVWQRKHKESEALRQQAAYWLETFAEPAPVMEMPTDYPRPAIKSYEGDHIYFEADAELSSRVSKQASEQGVTLYMYLLASYQVLLLHYTGQEDMVIGSPMSGRHDADVERMVGMFVNTMAMRGKPVRTKRFAGFLQEVRETTLQVHANRDYPFEDLVSELDVRRDTSRSPLFDYLFTLHNTVKEQVDLKQIGGSLYPFINRIAKFDLTLNAYEEAGVLSFSMEYSTKLFKRETIERLSRHWLKVLEEVSRDSGQLLGDVQVMAKEEEERLLALGEYEGTWRERVEEQWPAEWTGQATLDGWFAEQASRTPDRIAV